MPANIYLVLNGNSIDDTNQILGNDSSLDNKGIKYKDDLFNFFYNENIINNVIVLSSNEKKSKETLTFIKNKKELDYLNEIDYGDYNGKTKNLFFFSEDYHNYKYDIFNYKFKNGESYKDVKNRVLSVMFELHKICDFDDVIICANKTILQSIFGILTNVEDSKIPYIDINHSSIIKIKQGFDGFTYDTLNLNYNKYRFQ
jgi:broad specificity phosphatase PhoE